jgi:lambda repressor-like predicted transcriptional regulator
MSKKDHKHSTRSEVEQARRAKELRELMPQVIGQKFGRLTVIDYWDTKDRKRRWLLSCKCGNLVVETLPQLKARKRTSCGCFVIERKTKHGYARRGDYSTTYRAWRDMLGRCRPNSQNWKHYGARGIKVCERWLSFANFLADMGERPAGLSLDRKDVNGDYEPGNCRWATTIEQRRNTRRNKFLTYGGQTKTLAEWAEEKGLHRNTLYYRLKRGWTLERALGEQLNCRPLTFKGEVKTFAEWAAEAGIGVETLRRRLKRGWTMERLIAKRGK